MSGDIARDRTAPALHGSYTRDEALTRLLAGSAWAGATAATP
ncbi:STN domain-containing protein [Achromobacter insuavis]